MLMFAVPPAAGSNPTLFDTSPLLNVRPPTIVPTLVVQPLGGLLASQVAIDTLIGAASPLRSCPPPPAMVRFGFNIATPTVTVALLENVVVVKLVVAT